MADLQIGPCAPNRPPPVHATTVILSLPAGSTAGGIREAKYFAPSRYHAVILSEVREAKNLSAS